MWTFSHKMHYGHTEAIVFRPYFSKVYKSVWSYMAWFDTEPLHTQISS